MGQFVRGASWRTSALLVVLTGCSLVTDFDALEGSGPLDGSVDATAPRGDAAAVVDAMVDARVTDPPGIDAGVDAEAGGPSYPYQAAVLADAPASYWPLDDAAGSLVIVDRAGGHDGSILGALELGVAGLDGRTAMKISSNDTTIDLGTIFPFDSTAPFAIELWVLPDLAGDYNNLFEHRAGVQGWVAYVSRDGNVSYEQGWDNGGSRGVYSGESRTYTKLTQIVFSFDGTTMSEYVDGVASPHAYSAGDPDPPDYSAMLHLAVAYTGVIDEVSIYDHALTPARVQAHREAASQ